MAQTLLIVIPAKAGIQVFPGVLDPGFRRGDSSFIGHFILWSCTELISDWVFEQLRDFIYRGYLKPGVG